MKRRTLRVLGLAIAVAMLTCSFNVSAFAEELPTVVETEQEPEDVAETDLDIEEDLVKFVDGKLLISMDGEMPDYDKAEDTKWGAYSGTAEYTAIVGNVTKIGKNAFNGFGKLKIIVIPATVKVINDSAFEKCDALTEVYFGGCEKDWKAINISETGNDALKKAKINFCPKCGDPSKEEKPSKSETPATPSGNETPSGNHTPSGNETPSGNDAPSSNDLQKAAKEAGAAGYAELGDTAKIEGGKVSVSAGLAEAKITVLKGNKFILEGAEGSFKIDGAAKKYLSVNKKGLVKAKKATAEGGVVITYKKSADDTETKLNVSIYEPFIVNVSSNSVEIKKPLKLSAKAKKGEAIDIEVFAPLTAKFEDVSSTGINSEIDFTGTWHIYGTCSKKKVKVPFTVNGKKYIVKVKFK